MLSVLWCMFLCISERCSKLCLVVTQWPAAAEHLHVKPGKGAAFVRTKLKNSITSNTIDKTFRAGETVASATVEKKDSQFTYADGNEVSTTVCLLPLDAVDETPPVAIVGALLGCVCVSA